SPSPTGSAGKLHLTWRVPFEPGELKAVARRGGRTVATDVLRTAREAHAVRLTPDRETVAADGRSLVFVTAEVVDRHGVLVPGAEDLITFDVAGGSLAGLDNGRQESAERYQASTRTAFHGKALAIVRSGTRPGVLRVSARAHGLRTGTATVGGRRAPDPATTPAPGFRPGHPAPVDHPHADASYSGRPDTLPAAMIDGDPATGWSNGFRKAATALLPAFDGARPEDWISLAHGRTRRYGRIEVSFTVDDAHSLPAAVEVAVWDGRAWRAAGGAETDWATSSDAPTVVTFDAVRGSGVRLTLTSRHPGQARGAIRVSRLEAPAV
ncbi:DUF4982 domain-containing protein, partial [Streptomyces sp. Tu 4128]|uniref:DUF4982 domain-containing protein n=1 Tax=Streptomyces sp. Tu 4128 TaxID=1120314 RepID=UPI001F120782